MIKVRRIVGKFLEHTRIYYFHHHGEKKVLLSSADMMTRNMDNRVEILFPVLITHLKERICTCLHLILKDNVKAREQVSSGDYHYVETKSDEKEINSQLMLFKMAYCTRKWAGEKKRQELSFKRKLSNLSNYYFSRLKKTLLL
ncbi:hypothetical protein [Bacillus sp. V3B]|uniref:hypothetical protein n=1 Tax=Bacillus sp. V3B TaxID=2804915 RepID=UPI0028122408|nr:hypothetical protein [Bacillus sp. V3B]